MWKKTGEVVEVTFDTLRESGLTGADEEKVFRLCSEKIREEDREKDAFLLYLTFEMFKKQQYDKATLTYLGEYFCGATRDMKRLWEVMREYEIPSYKVAERIITQMLFSGKYF